MLDPTVYFWHCIFSFTAKLDKVMWMPGNNHDHDQSHESQYNIHQSSSKHNMWSTIQMSGGCKNNGAVPLPATGEWNYDQPAVGGRGRAKLRPNLLYDHFHFQSCQQPAGQQSKGRQPEKASPKTKTPVTLYPWQT